LNLFSFFIVTKRIAISCKLCLRWFITKRIAISCRKVYVDSSPKKLQFLLFIVVFFFMIHSFFLFPFLFCLIHWFYLILIFLRNNSFPLIINHWLIHYLKVNKVLWNLKSPCYKISQILVLRILIVKSLLKKSFKIPQNQYNLTKSLKSSRFFFVKIVFQTLINFSIQKKISNLKIAQMSTTPSVQFYLSHFDCRYYLYISFWFYFFIHK
jgi:hypothetical protein